MTWSVVILCKTIPLKLYLSIGVLKRAIAPGRTQKKSNLKNAVISRIKPKKKTFNLFKARTLAYNIGELNILILNYLLYYKYYVRYVIYFNLM